MVEFQDVSVTYGNGVDALNNVSLKIKDGEFAFVVGPSGAGKSTLIKLILKEVSPTSGRVLVNGFSINKLKRRDIPKLRRTIGVVFQDFRLLKDRNVYDNVAFAQGPVVEQFAPADHSIPDYFIIKDIETVISLKAETHNFPTTVEPFNGASTGSGGEIRDRMGGGKGSWPIAGTAVYMTSYPRTYDDRKWEEVLPVRKWLYQTPEQILTKASNGASDFGNKFGQPLICGSAP